MKFMRENFPSLSAKIKHYFKKYERYLSGLAFIGGFLVDTLILPRIDFWGAYAILGTYLLFVMFTILFSFLHDTNHPIRRYLLTFIPILPVATQFFFGSLMSAIFVYYSRSATVIESVPFMLLLFFVFVGNEIFRSRLTRLEFQLTILFFIVYMGMTFAVPVFLGVMGPWVFLLSGGIAVSIMILYILVLRFFSRTTISRIVFILIGSTSGILVLVNVLYFTHIIPPIPLSMRAGGVYHSITRMEGGIYRAYGEKTSIMEHLTHSYPVIHITHEPLYFFSAIFAPTTFAETIIHVWQYYDNDTKKWITKYRFPFRVIGGRDGGYRGYSIKNNLIPGHWRVRVETARGELLGSVTFLAVLATSPIILEDHDL